MAVCFVCRRNALRVGVSRSLVSIVFSTQPGASDETRARVRASAAEIGYRPDTGSQLLSRKQTQLIGISFDGARVHAELVTELYAVARAIGYQLGLSGVTPDRTEQHAAQDLLAFGYDAVILLGLQRSTREPCADRAEGSRAAGWLIDRRDNDRATAALVFNDESAVGSWPLYEPLASTFHDNCLGSCGRR